MPLREYKAVWNNMRVVARLLRHRGCPWWEAYLLAWLIEGRKHRLSL